MFSSQFFSSFFSYSYKNYALLNDIPDTLITWAASIGSGLVNGVTRLIIGGLHKKLGTKVLFFVLMIPQTIVAFTCYIAVDYPPVFFLYVLINYY